MSDLVGNPEARFSRVEAVLTVGSLQETCLQSFRSVQTQIKWAATQENRSSGFPTRFDTNRPVPAQKRARSLKFRI